MSFETSFGVEELQRDEDDVIKDLDKKFSIHLPTKQVSTSSYGSRRSSLSAIQVSPSKGSINLQEDPKPLKPEPARKFSTIREKAKIKGKKKKNRLKSAKRKLSNKELKKISDLEQVEEY